MKNNETALESLFEKVGEYRETTVELLKLNAISKTAEVASSLLSNALILCVVLLCIIIVNIGLAMWVGELLGKQYYGFFAVAGFYLLATIILLVFKKSLLKFPFNNFFITQLLK
jgi:hypothetical protein